MFNTTTHYGYCVTPKYILIKGTVWLWSYLDYIDLLEKKSNVVKYKEKCYNFEDKIYGFFL